MADKGKGNYYVASQEAGGMGKKPDMSLLAAEARQREIHEADEAEQDTKRRNLKANYTASPTFRLSTTEMPRRRAVMAKSEKKPTAY